MPLDPRIDAIREKYGLERSDLWELPQKKGTWIAKHAALEVAAVKAGIRFDMPVIIEQDANGLICSLVVQGEMEGRTEWSIGETNPSNYRVSGKQPSYPWAMAEKRSKDRVILKLIGLHGLVYSEEEADDFKGSAQRAPDDEPEPMPNTAAKVHWKTISDELFKCATLKQLKGCWERHYRVYETLPPDLQRALQEWKDELKDKLLAQGEVGSTPIPPNFDNMEPTNG
jgi:hypothetical protein